MPLTTTTTTRLAALILRRRICVARSYSNSASDPIESDVVIIGGGVAGLALASALGTSLNTRFNAHSVRSYSRIFSLRSDEINGYSCRRWGFGEGQDMEASTRRVLESSRFSHK